MSLFSLQMQQLKQNVFSLQPILQRRVFKANQFDDFFMHLKNKGNNSSMQIFMYANRCFTLVENYSKCRIWNFYFRHFPPIFLQLKLTGLVTLFDRKLLVFRNSPKWTIFGFFKWIFVFLNCNVAQFVRNFEWDLFLWFSNTVMPGGIPSFLSKIDFFPNGNFSGFSIIQIPCWVRKRCHKNFFL